MDYDVLWNGAHMNCGADSLTEPHDGNSSLSGVENDDQELYRLQQAERRRKAKAYWEKKRAERSEPVE